MLLRSFALAAVARHFGPRGGSWREPGIGNDPNGYLSGTDLTGRPAAELPIAPSRNQRIRTMARCRSLLRSQASPNSQS